MKVATTPVNNAFESWTPAIGTGKQNADVQTSPDPCETFFDLYQLSATTKYTQLSKQPGPLSYEFLSLNSSVYGKFKDTEDKIFILANNQTNLQIELKQAENNITDLFHSKEELQVQIFKKINETIQRQFEKEENRIEQKFDDIERKLNQLTSNPGSLNGKQVECCPIDWQIFRHSCYYFSTDYSAWSKARSKCKVSESDLVIINRPEEQGFLTLKVKEYNSKRGTWSNELWYWIGMTDNEKEGMWKWVDGTLCDCIKNQKGFMKSVLHSKADFCFER
ncbi:asialoglycoprotein receptor 1-like [Protopterus annectens]|uniref:asialoglycoprotein receptor 1-like n=1 Tax=Protopterus annectens TaxID=7888 RepID=UPI001CFACD18|nr:asialoglycoprotein receptor 1-like [Protopterus annectens]